MDLRGVIPTFRSLLPYFFSHHPICKFFYHDTYSVSGKRVCLGCSITYPIAIAAFVVLTFTQVADNLPQPLFHHSILLLTSIILGLIQALKYGSMTEGRSYRVLVKIFLGLAIGGVVYWTLTIPIPLLFRLIILFIAVASIMFLGTFRIIYMRRICAGCIYHGDWDICYGFRGINKYFHFKNFRSKKELNALIFDRERKRKGDYGTGPNMSNQNNEPDLADDTRWLFDDKKGDIPWLPKTGLEINSLTKIPGSGDGHKR